MLPASTYRAFARECPTRPVRLVVAFAAGGGTDIAARVIGQWLSLRLGQSFLIENRPGAGSSAAAELVVNAPPDGYTLLACGLANAVNATLYSKLPYNFGRDLAPVAGLINTPNITVVNPSFPAKSVLEFIPHAKANPGKLNMASAGGRERHPHDRRVVQDAAVPEPVALLLRCYVGHGLPDVRPEPR